MQNLVNILFFNLSLEEDAKDKKTTESYTGGEKSGMAVENPDDIDGVINQAKANSEKRKAGEA